MYINGKYIPDFECFTYIFTYKLILYNIFENIKKFCLIQAMAIIYFFIQIRLFIKYINNIYHIKIYNQ